MYLLVPTMLTANGIGQMYMAIPLDYQPASTDLRVEWPSAYLRYIPLGSQRNRIEEFIVWILIGVLVLLCLPIVVRTLASTGLRWYAVSAAADLPLCSAGRRADRRGHTGVRRLPPR